MGDRPNITAHGVTGGQVENSYVAGISYGGMGGRNVNLGPHGQYAEGTHASMIQEAQKPTVGKKDPRNLKAAELLEQIRSSECTDETIKIFEQNRVTGTLFMNGDLGELLDALGIANKIDKMKLKSLKKVLGDGL